MGKGGGKSSARGGGGGGSRVGAAGSTLKKSDENGRDWTDKEISQVNSLAEGSKDVGVAWGENGFNANIYFDGERVATIRPQGDKGAYVADRGLGIEQSYSSMARAVSSISKKLDKLR